MVTYDLGVIAGRADPVALAASRASRSRDPGTNDDFVFLTRSPSSEG